MTKHQPNCDCDLCFAKELNAVLRRFAEQREARQADQHNAAAIRLATEQSAWRDVVEPMPGSKPGIQQKEFV